MNLPLKLQEIIKNFNSMPKSLRLSALLEYSKTLPEFPEKYNNHPELLKPVPECTTPMFLVAEKIDDKVYLHFKVSLEAPTIRGYANILKQSLDGKTAQEILDVPDQFYLEMGLVELITPLRMRGIAALLMRIKNELK